MAKKIPIEAKIHALRDASDALIYHESDADEPFDKEARTELAKRLSKQAVKLMEKRDAMKARNGQEK